MKNKEIKCLVCGEVNDESICVTCDENGYWIDPAGGIHCDDPDDDNWSDPTELYK